MRPIVKAKRRCGLSPAVDLKIFIRLAQTLAIVKLLVGQGASLAETNSEGETLLHLAATNAQLDLCEYLLGAGLEVNARMNNGLTPLHYAAAIKQQPKWCFQGDGTAEIALVKLLLAHGAEVNAEAVADVEVTTKTQIRSEKRRITPLGYATIVESPLPFGEDLPTQMPVGSTRKDLEEMNNNIERLNRTRQAIATILRATRGSVSGYSGCTGGSRRGRSPTRIGIDFKNWWARCTRPPYNSQRPCQSADRRSKPGKCSAAESSGRGRARAPPSPSERP